jgi:hypothetical protein
MSSQNEQRYCAFVDILGFTELIKGLRDGTVRYEFIRDLLKQIHRPHDPKFVGLGETDFQAQSISDAVALSTRFTAAGLGILFDTLERLSLALLREGYFTRGAVCRGMLYHDANMIFGEALIKAYKLEAEVVKYPRIMLMKDVVDGALASNLKQYFVDRIKQAEDGPFFLHVLSQIEMITGIQERRPPDSREPPLDFSRFEIMRNRIQARFDQSVDNPRHFEKVQWFARYFNDTVGSGHPEINLITGPGLDTAGKFG